MAVEKDTSPMGRPRKEITKEEFEKLCGLHCTLEEAAGWFHMSADTLNARLVEMYGQTFSEVFKRYSAPGKVSLRRKMFELALGGNVTMCIWLSKQHIGMTDKVEQRSYEIKKQLTPDEIKDLIHNDPALTPTQ